MSAKQTILGLVGELPDTASWGEIVKLLHDHTRAHPEVLGEGAADFEWPAPDLTHNEWALFIASTLADELNDPREDIYTLDDGTPTDDAR